MMNLRHSIHKAALVYLAVLPGFVLGSVSVKLKQPDWQFLIENQPLAETEVQLEPSERGFVRNLRQHLSVQNYSAVAAIFANRSLEDDSAALLLLRGQVLLSTKDYTGAENALRIALKKAPNFARAHRTLSAVYMLTNKYDDAKQHLTRSIELGVADAQLYGQLAYLNLQSDKPWSAIAGYQQAAFLEPDNEQWEQGLLYALINVRSYDQAQALIEQQLQKKHQNSELWLLRSQIALQRKEFANALNSLEIAIRLGNKAPDNQFTAAQLHLEHGSIERAVELLSDNVKRLKSHQVKSNFKTIEQVVAWLSYQEEWSSLDKLLAACISVKNQFTQPQQSVFNVYRAKSELHRGQSGKAEIWLKEAIDGDPTSGDALLTLAELYKSQNKLEQAIMLYVRAGVIPEFKERAQLGQVQLEIDRQNYRSALQLLQQVVRNNPDRNDLAANIRSLENLLRHQG